MDLPQHPYRPLIERVCQRYPPVPPNVLEAVVWVESGFDPRARSASDARGLAQIIPRIHGPTLGVKVADELGVPLTDDLWYDPEFSLRAGARHLAWLSTADATPSWERAVRAYHSGAYDPPAGFVDGQGTSSDQHIEKFRQALAAVQAARGGSPMPTYQIPGLPGGPLTTSFPVRLRIVPASRTNNRPGIKARTPRLTVQHETANPNTFAAGEAEYLYTGAGGRQASWHMTVDDAEAVISIPLDEVTWQAGDGSGPGNMQGISCELSVHSAIVNSPARKDQARRNAAELQGRIAARFGAPPPANQHAKFMVKNCPAVLRGEAGAWPQYLTDWAAFYEDERTRMRGENPTPPGPATAPKGWEAGAIVRFSGDTEALNMRWEAGLGWGVKDALQPGEQARILKAPVAVDGFTWYPIEIDSRRNGWVAGEYLTLVTAAAEAPPPAPAYAPPVKVPALFGTDLRKYDTAPGIVSADGTDWIFVADVIEATRDTKRLAWADDAAPETSPPLKAGERTIAAWIVKAANGVWYYLTPDPEWERIAYEDTRRVADAPLLGDEWDGTAGPAPRTLEVVLQERGG